MILKDHVIVPMGHVNMIHNSLQRLKFLEADLSLTIKELEDTPRHRYGPETDALETEVRRLNHVKMMQQDLSTLLKEIQSTKLG